MESEQYVALMFEIQSLRKEVSNLKGLFGNVSDPIKFESVYKPNLEGFNAKISALLNELRMPAHVQGYTMVREAIKRVHQDGNLLRGFTTELYPQIAKLYDSTASRVERAIRHAIETSYNKSQLHPFYASNFPRHKPTNSEFISLIADKFWLEENSKMEVI